MFSSWDSFFDNSGCTILTSQHPRDIRYLTISRDLNIAASEMNRRSIRRWSDQLVATDWRAARVILDLIEERIESKIGWKIA